MKEIAFDRDNIGGVHLVMAFPPANYELHENYATREFALETVDSSLIVRIPTYAGVSFSFAETHGRDEHGDWWQPTVKGVIPKQCQDNAALIEELEHGEWVVLCEDANGVLHLCGDTDTPLLFSTDAGTGENPADLNGTVFTFTGKLGHPSHVITEII